MNPFLILSFFRFFPHYLMIYSSRQTANYNHHLEQIPGDNITYQPCPDPARIPMLNNDPPAKLSLLPMKLQVLPSGPNSKVAAWAHQPPAQAPGMNRRTPPRARTQPNLSDLLTRVPSRPSARKVSGFLARNGVRFLARNGVRFLTRSELGFLVSAEDRSLNDPHGTLHQDQAFGHPRSVESTNVSNKIKSNS